MWIPPTLESFLSALKDPGWEPGLDDFRETLEKLNQIAFTACGGDTRRLEGNFFYPRPHEQETIPARLDPRIRNKRRNYASFIMSGRSLLEVGFNAGHSALLALTINPEVCYHGIDLGHHPYVRPCYEYLRSEFGDRIKLTIGDSLTVLPSLHDLPHTYDLFHIDGGHGFAAAVADLKNMLPLCRSGNVILFDDTNFDHLLLDELCDYFALRGLVSRICLSKLWTGNDHVALRVI